MILQYAVHTKTKQFDNFINYHKLSKTLVWKCLLILRYYSD